MKQFRIKLFLSCFALALLIMLGTLFYSKTSAQNYGCSSQTPQRAQGLVSVPNLVGKFFTPGGCIVDPKAAFIPLYASYDDLKSRYYTQAKSSLKSQAPNSPNQGQFTSAFTKNIVLINGNLGDVHDINYSTAGTQPAVIFVEGNLSIRSNIVYGDNRSGLVFVVKSNVNIYQDVTQVDGVIMAEGIICTAFDGTSCPSTNIQTSQLTINGSLISLNEANPIKFRRTLTQIANFSQPAEKIVHQPKFLVIFRNFLADTYQKWSEVDASFPLPSPGATPTPTPTPPPPPPPPPSACQTAGLTSGLLAYWKFDSSTTTSASVGGAVMNLTNSGGATFSGAGKINQAVALNGSNQSLSCAYSTCGGSGKLNPTTGITLSAWVNPSGTGNQLIMGQENTAGTTGYFLAWSSGNIGFLVNTTSGGRLLAYNGSLSNGTWYFLTGTYDGSNMKLYVNGAVMNTVPWSGTLLDNNLDFFIGANAAPWHAYFNGSIDEVGIWNRALTASEITNTLYNSGAGITCP